MTKSVNTEYPLVRYPRAQDNTVILYNHASLQTSSADQGTILKLFMRPSSNALTDLFWLVACKLICWLMSPYFFSLEANVGLYSSNKSCSEHPPHLLQPLDINF